MSTSPPPQSGSVDRTRVRKRDRPPALELDAPDPHLNLEEEFEFISQPRVEVSLTEPHQPCINEMTRSTSAASSSSLDPYYFTSLAPAESPVPPLPAGPDVIPRTPELPLALPPTTPARNPATIDRRGLVGVGELATPRWTRYEHATRHAHDLDIVDAMDDVAEVDELALAENDGERETDSPWTIEAVDELRDEVVDENPNAPMAIRARASMASESGGEEILYPRKATNSDVFHPMSSPTPAVPLQPNATREDLTSSDPSTIGSSSSTAGSYAQFGTPITAKQRRPRTSDPDTDSSGVFSPKHASPRDKLREDKLASVRKHQSLGLGIGSSTATPRDNSHRESSTLGSSSVVRASSTKHSRSSSSSSQVKRGHDFSHLPPSPSATSLHHSVKHAPAGSTTSPHHTSNVVAHSLLRGTQEGWSSMDDEATAEALRKLDGVSGKSPHARGRTSIGSRPTSMSRPNSRPGTPGAVRGSQWEGIAAFEGGGRSSRSSKKTSSSGDEKRVSTSSKAAPSTGLDDEFSEGHISSQSVDRLSSTKKRSSVVASKRGSGSSTTYTGTPTASSRDSGSISVGTSLTSASANSHRQSLKAQRNSAGSDISVHSSEVASLKDRAAALMSTNEVFESEHVPPVPPLPKDLSSFRSPPQSSTSVHFPTIPMPPRMDETDPDQTVSMDTAPVPDSPLHGQALSPVSPVQAQSQERPPTSAYTPASRPTPKTPSKKWSFNLKLPGSPASPRNTAPKAISSPISSSVPTETTIPPLTVKRSMDAWSQPDAMMSAASLGSLSSVGSVRGSPAASLAPSFTITSSPDPMQAQVPLLTTTATRTSIDQASGGLAPAQTPLSPSSSLRRGSSTRRLTPSSIPFFRRSSSQVAQPQSESEALRSRSPPLASPAKKPAARLRVKSTISPTDASLSSPATPGSTQKKSSMLSFLRGSSSRKSLQSDREQADARSDREQRKLGKEAEKSIDKDRKKDDKDRSESRISVLMGRKRGKTLSSSDPKKAKSTVAMPPIQVGALSSATVQRVASFSSSTSTPVSSVSNRVPSSRVTAQTISSMHKQSDTSLRSSRNQLPTIAGSPSVATAAESSNNGFKEPSLPPPSSLNVSTSLPKETPTKIPRMAGQLSAIPSPTLKGSVSSVSTVTARRTSLNVSSLTPSATPSINNVSPSPSAANNKENALDEFGVLGSNGESKNVATPTHRLSVRASPSVASTTSRVPRQASAPATASTRKNRESLSFAGLRKASTSSVTSLSSAAPSDTQSQAPSQSRFSALSPSKGLKLLTPKISLSSTRHHATTSSSTAVVGSASSSRQSLSTPSPVPSSIDDEEQQGDEEMLQCVRRQQAKKLSNGASQEELDEMFKFPEPLPPVNPSAPGDVLKSSQVKYLSEYERKEILEHDKVYFFGARSQKKYATLDNSTNNHGYDDDRGDYLVVNHDHLGYRYEVVGSLGKGSFGQVLKCRDHATGEFVAIKIIRNKKRFHHQAQVEIKILENLRKWDPEDKHQCIKMIEHFTFRGHLCIAMELLSINLYELIKANGFVGFSTTLIRRFTNQMLLSLSLMRHHRIVHCDLKPENVLLKHPAKSAIKVIDFGSSCLEHEKIYTYIQSRFYRSPEVIMGMNYHMAIDMWSLACIMAELYTGFPIFPGENEQEQLSCIMEVLGVPDKDFINRSSRKKLFFDASGAPRPVVNSKGRRRRPGTKSLAQVLRCEDELFVDFIAKCLTWDPERRMKPQQALRHPFILPQRRPRVLSPVSGTRSLLSSASSSITSSSRSKPTETPKKSQIGAPTPLTSRVSRTNSSTVSSTPLASASSTTLGSSSRSYRASQSQTFSTHYSSKTMSSFTAAK